MEPHEDFTEPPWGTAGRTFTFGVVAAGSKILLQALNTFSITGGDRFQECVMRRPAGQGLITVCNHTSTLDDPCVLSALLPWSFFLTEHQHQGIRWSLCAREVCYKNVMFKQLFQNGKTLPIDRGAGVDQPIMQVAAAKAREGDWVHVFPEAKVGYTGKLGSVRWGVGKLVCDSVKDGQTPPIIVPFYHSGMGRVMPKGSIVPRVFKDIQVTVGAPVDVSDVTPCCNCAEYKQSEVWIEIAERIAAALAALEARSPPNWDQKANAAASSRTAIQEPITEPGKPSAD